jgi:hypothetical protein
MRCLKSLKLGLVMAVGLSTTMPGARAASSMAELLPQLKTMGPPAWLKPGARLSFYSASATVGGDFHYFVPDEKGGWVTPDGKYWDQKENLGGSGEGLIQLDAAVVGSERALFNLRMFLIAQQDVGGKQILPRAVSVAVGPVAACEDYYVNPAALAGLQAAKHDHLTILPMPYTLDGHTYDCVSFKYQTDTAYTCSIYDKATGIMLASAASVAAGNNDKFGSKGGTNLMVARFKGLRQRDVSWAEAPAPGWLHTVRRMTGSGTYTVTMANTPQFPLAVDVVNDVDERGSDWFLFHQTSTIAMAQGMPPQTSTAVMLAGPAQIGGLWMAPAALTRFTAGQVLDSDPLIGTRTSVVAVRGNLVQIREAGGSHVIDFLYDSGSGQLQRVRQSETTNNMAAGAVTTTVDVRMTGAQ